jgi:hypothetical protein
VEEAEKSCSMNGKELEGHILRYWRVTCSINELEGHALRYRSITFLDRYLWVTFSGTGGSRAQLQN